MDGTPRALLPITERVMVWVSEQKARISTWEAAFARSQCDATEARAALQGRADMIRSIELCALAARDVAMFHDLYVNTGGVPSAAAPEVQEQRGAPGGLPSPEGAGCGCRRCEPGAPCH